MIDPAHSIAAFRAAREWAAEHGHQQPDDRMLKAYGRALVGEHHLPLLDLTADEVETIRDIVALFAERVGAIDTEDAIVAAALDKLTTSTEETQP